MAGCLVGSIALFVYIYTHMHTQLNRDGRFALVESFHDVIDRSPRGRCTHAHTYSSTFLCVPSTESTYTLMCQD